MGNYRDANITEIRIFEEPSDPVNSDYRVALPITATEAVYDLDRRMNLKDILAELYGDIEMILILLTNSIPGADSYVVGFENLTSFNLVIIDGVWDPVQRMVWA
jgi:hypothetical protein